MTQGSEDLNNDPSRDAKFAGFGKTETDAHESAISDDPVIAELQGLSTSESPIAQKIAGLPAEILADVDMYVINPGNIGPNAFASIEDQDTASKINGLIEEFVAGQDWQARQATGKKIAELLQ